MANINTVHGVLLCVKNTGVLITGKSGIGKSELALALIKAGHQLIADDIIELQCQQQQLIGRCPPLLQDFLEVRGIGILNVRKLFGDQAVAKQHAIDLIVHFELLPKQRITAIERITGQHDNLSLCGSIIPKVTVPIAAGRNLAILLETAVDDFLLHQQGYDAQQDFVKRHEQQLRAEKPCD